MILINANASDWVPVTNGVTQDSVLGAVLFIIYKNDIDVGKFAEYTKIRNSLTSDRDRQSLQEDLRKISA